MAKKETKQVGGRTIAAWKERLREKYPEAWRSDPSTQGERIKAMADDVNAWAQEGGYNFSADSQQVIKWIEQDRKAKQPERRTRQQPVAAPDRSNEEGEALGTLRTLVKLLGKEQVKKIVDTL